MAQPNPLIKQILNLLNGAGRVSSGALDKTGHRDVAPILNSILKLGYSTGISGVMSDEDALRSAIGAARQGYGFGQNAGDLRLVTDNPNFSRGTASGNMLKSLLGEYTKKGMSKAEAQAFLHDQLKQENFLLRQADLNKDQGGTLPTNVSDALSQRRQAKKGLGAGGDQSAAFDPSAVADATVLGDYVKQGQGQIEQYKQVAGLMSGLVPAQLQPLYSLMVDQRASEMQNNLDQYNAQMQVAPYVQAMKHFAQDQIKGAGKSSGSGLGGLSSGLDGLTPQSGTQGGTFASDPSSTGLNGRDLGREILDQFKLGDQYSSGYNKWLNPVISPSQTGYLRDFIPRSSAGANNVPSIMDYLSAFAPQGQ